MFLQSSAIYKSSLNKNQNRFFFIGRRINQFWPKMIDMLHWESGHYQWIS